MLLLLQVLQVHTADHTLCIRVDTRGCLGDSRRNRGQRGIGSIVGSSRSRSSNMLVPYGFALGSLGVDGFLGLLRVAERVDVRPELDDFAEEVLALALPVSHGFCVVGVTRRVLQSGQVSSGSMIDDGGENLTYSKINGLLKLIVLLEVCLDVDHVRCESTQLVCLHELAGHHALTRRVPVID